MDALELALAFGAGWWIGDQMSKAQTSSASSPPIVDPNVIAAQNAAAQIAAQTSDGSAVPGATPDTDASNEAASGAPLVATMMDPNAGAPPVIKDTGMTVQGMPVCIDSFNNLVDCTTGQPLDDATANVIINSLQVTRPTGPIGRW